MEQKTAYEEVTVYAKNLLNEWNKEQEEIAKEYDLNLKDKLREVKYQIVEYGLENENNFEKLLNIYYGPRGALIGENRVEFKELLLLNDKDDELLFIISLHKENNKLERVFTYYCCFLEHKKDYEDLFELIKNDENKEFLELALEYLS